MLGDSLRRRGVLGTLRHAAKRLVPGFRQRAARRVEERVRTREETTREFDEAHGVETGGYVRPADLKMDAEARRHANAYEPILPHEFHAMMRAAGPVAAGRTFVDVGCGKGRALLLAAKYPFARIVGVELAEDLAQRARENADAFRRDAPTSPEIRVVAGDATELEFPAGPLVVFLFNPFDEALMEKLVANLASSMERQARPVTVVYANARHAALFDRIRFPRRVVRGRPTVAGEAGYSTWSIHHFEPTPPR
jgi:SAM-dependent methyltransferase